MNWYEEKTQQKEDKMKIKFLYTALVGLVINSGIANAAEQFGKLSIADGSDTGRQVTSFQGDNIATSGDIISSDSYHKNVEMTQRLSSTEILQYDISINYLGKDLSTIAHFVSYLNNYQKEIIISEQDTINIGQFSKYFCQNLLDYSFYKQTIIPQEFELFKGSSNKAFDSFAYVNNCIFFALTNYLAKPDAKPIEIINNYNNYNNLRFKFSRCNFSYHLKGTPLNLLFNKDDVPSIRHGLTTIYGSIADIPSSDTIMNSLWTAEMYSIAYDVRYKLTLFKIEENTFRINVKLSSKDFPSSSFERFKSNEYKPRQVSNILLEIKK